MGQSTFVGIGIGGGSGGGGGALPTAPAGQVLISQGDGIPPIFSTEVIISNPIAPSGQKYWKLNVGTDGTYRIQMLNDALIPVPGKKIEIDPYVGGLSTAGGPIGSPQNTVGAKWFNFTPVAFSELPPFSPIGIAGNLANVTDSNTVVIGATVAGGGANNILARWNGTIWRVIGV